MSASRLCCTLLALALAGCASTTALRAGNYLESFGPGVASSSAKQLTLYPGREFAFRQWASAVGSGKQGRGTYTLRGRQLTLLFDGRSLQQTPRVQAQALTASPDSTVVQVALHYGQLTPDGFMVKAVDATRHSLRETASNQLGRAVLRLPAGQHPAYLTIEGVGFQRVEQPWPATSTTYTVEVAQREGLVVPAGSVRQFQVLGQTKVALLLRQGPDTLTLVAAAPQP